MGLKNSFLARIRLMQSEQEFIRYPSNIKIVISKLQSGISNRMKAGKEKICALTEFLQG